MNRSIKGFASFKCPPKKRGGMSHLCNLHSKRFRQQREGVPTAAGGVPTTAGSTPTATGSAPTAAGRRSDSSGKRSDSSGKRSDSSRKRSDSSGKHSDSSGKAFRLLPEEPFAEVNFCWICKVVCLSPRLAPGITPARRCRSSGVTSHFSESFSESFSPLALDFSSLCSSQNHS
jgi:hypothetical protein